MSDDIAEFLRRAAQRRAQPPPDLEILDAEVVDAEILEVDKVSGEDVSRQVSKHLNTSSFTERASHLGEFVDQSDDRMEARLESVFEHRLGQLGTRTSETAESTLDDDEPSKGQKKPASATTTGLVAMLRDPQTLRNVIVAREIFNRPEHLW
jgi:hypothetical protein